MSFFGTLWRVIRQMRESRGKLAAIIVAGITVALIQVVEAIFFGRAVNALIEQDDAGALFAGWVALAIAGIVLAVGTGLAADRLAHRNKLRVLSEAFQATMTPEPDLTRSEGMGGVIRNVLMGCDSFFQVWLNAFRESIPAFAALIVLIPIALSMSVVLTMTLLLLIIAYTVATVAIMNRTYADQKSVDFHYRALSSRLADVMNNAPVVHAFSRLHLEVDAIRGLTSAILQRQFPVLNWWAVLNVLTQAASTIAVVAVLLVGSFLIARTTMTIGEVVTFVGFANLMIGRLQQTAGALTRLYPQAPVMQALLDIISRGGESREDAGRPDLRPGPGAVRFENVSFRFPGSHTGVRDIDFTAEAGTVTAIVGTTGAGKTTLLALLQRLFRPHEGRILIDGQDISSVNQRSVRRAISVVSQNAGLFDRSLADNLRVGKPNATKDELLSALDRAQLGDLIALKPGGLEFRLGEGASALSGGERQRLSIARALLKESRILLLDEATSALDTVTEAKVQRAIDEASSHRTTFIIAHRLSTIRNADMVFVMERGRIVQRGSPSELRDADGPFRSFLAAAEGEAIHQIERELEKV